MAPGDDYYGKYQKVSNNHRGISGSPKNFWRIWCIILLVLPCFILMGMNTYLLYETQKDYIKIKDQLTKATLTLEEMHGIIRTSVKPQVDVLTSFLSYQLPSAIMSAFRKTNSELTHQLGGITVNLVNLIDMYKSLLGFNEDWMLMPDTRHITCTFVDNHDMSESWERIKNSREKYQNQMRKPFETSLNPDQFTDSNQLNETLLTGLSQHKGPKGDKVPGILGVVLDTLKNYFGENETYVSVYEGIKKRLMPNGLLTNNSPKEIKYIPTQSPTPSQHPSLHSRRRRYAASLVRRPRSTNNLDEYDYYDGSDIHIHTITNSVPDMCSVTKKILGFENFDCPTTKTVVEYLGCLLADLAGSHGEY